MTSVTEALDRLAPSDAWQSDWTDVLRRASEGGQRLAASRRMRPRNLGRKRVVLLAATLVAVIAAGTALAAINHWWFLGAGSGLPRAGQSPTVVTRGSWSGHRWTLVAYPSKQTTQLNGLCWGVNFSGAPAPYNGGVIYSLYGTAIQHGAADGVGCGSLVGAQNRRLPSELIPTVTYEWTTPSFGYPGWIAGVTVASATHLVIRWPAKPASPGRLATPRLVVEAATFPAPVAGYRVRLFAAQLPKPLVRHTRIATGWTLPASITGTDRHGRVVACYSIASSGEVAPLSYCKP
jgi:hypothetical protein